MFKVGTWSIWTQFFPPMNGSPITANDVPNQARRVSIVTGGSSGLGVALTKILHAAGGKAYILSRTESNVKKATTPSRNASKTRAKILCTS